MVDMMRDEVTDAEIAALGREAREAGDELMALRAEIALGSIGPVQRARAREACRVAILEARASQTRSLTDRERARIRANASGEDVFCGDDASAEQIARGACDSDVEWSEDARLEAIRIARAAWDASR